MLPRAKALRALRDLCEMPPLAMPGTVFDDSLGITGHSEHGTKADMVRFMGAPLGFGGSDARVAGHWLRDENEPCAEAPAPGARGIPAGAPNARGAMERRYTHGPNRRG